MATLPCSLLPASAAAHATTPLPALASASTCPSVALPNFNKTLVELACILRVHPRANKDMETYLSTALGDDAQAADLAKRMSSEGVALSDLSDLDEDHLIVSQR